MGTTGAVKMIERACPRCDGKGRIDGFGHVLGGVCFECSGSRTVLAPADWRERAAAADKRARARAAARAGKGANDRLWTEFTTAHPAQAAFIDRHRAAAADERNRLAVWCANAHSTVATYAERDSNPTEALDIVRRACRDFHVTLND
jgi:hypothetical protein